jgi:hypothetical protein
MEVSNIFTSSVKFSINVLCEVIFVASCIDSVSLKLKTLFQMADYI